eukprot:TRINITY_DN17889_c0_g1_i3.p1 TRINITY_DN17889_c0_g1~~TRINITY_DN17889_c0_g1_i3.p1  ORF type:complete len:418 (-),score=99.09 TRINITY_DN17889_c0_g1_i3:160-1371(-)
MGAKGAKESHQENTTGLISPAPERRFEHLLEKKLSRTCCDGMIEYSSVFSSEDMQRALFRFLLLGASCQGKRTFQVGLSFIFLGVDDETLRAYRPRLKTNIAEGLLSVCAVLVQNKMQVLPENTDFFNIIKVWDDSSSMHTIPDFFSRVVRFVNDPAVVSAMGQDLRYTGKDDFMNEMQLTMVQNIQKYEMLLTPGLDQFVPDIDDMLKCRFRTTGIVETNMKISGTNCRVFRIGYKNARRRWDNQVFGSNPNIVFFVSLADYDRTFYDDSSMHSIVESLDIWETLVSDKSFSKSRFCVIFSKADLFRDKLHYKFPSDNTSSNFKFKFSESESVQENERKFVEFLKSEMISRTPEGKRPQINFFNPVSLLDLGDVRSLMFGILKSCCPKIDQQGLLFGSYEVN